MTASGDATSHRESIGPAAFGMAIGLGLAGAIAATVFLEVVHVGQHALFVSVPEAMGVSGTPLWWVAVVLLVGAALVAVAYQLPGHRGEGPLTGFHFSTPVRVVPSVLIAALASLIFGFVLGPEAPLIVLGSTIGALVARRADARTQAFAGLLGGVAAIGAVFGNPFVTAFMILEFGAMGLLPTVALLPALVALASGYLAQVGVGAWSGFGTHSLGIPGLPAYDSAQLIDLAVGLGVALAAGLLATGARQLGERIDMGTARRPRAMPLAAAVVIVALVAIAGSMGIEPMDILFSGQGDPMASLLAQTSIAPVIAIVAFKAVAYALSLGGGFRGGPIFPATFLGLGVGALAGLIVPSVSLSAMVAVGIAATSTVMTRLPFTSGLLAMLLVGGAGAAIAPMAIIGAVVGIILRQAVDRRTPSLTSSTA